MIKTLMGSIRDYKKVTIATPLLVLGEVICEMMIPFITANLIDAIKDGATVAEMLPTAGFLVLIALTSLAFGAAAGVTCSHASCGFAKNLQGNLRQSDIICRWGGEEFILLLKDTGSSTARQLAEKIRQQTEEAVFPFNGVNLRVTTSIGVTELQGDDSMDRLIGRADRALYRAKQSGRNRVCEDVSGLQQ